MKGAKTMFSANGCRSVFNGLVAVLVSALVSTTAFAGNGYVTSDGDAFWSVDEYGWRSGYIPNEQGNSWIEMTVTGPGTWSCNWSVSCGYNYGFLILYVDGVVVTYITGDTDWQSVSYVLGEGTHTIVVNYQKIATSPNGYGYHDCGWVDNWKWLPATADVMLTVGKYVKMTLPELGYNVPTNGTPYDVVAKGLPAGLKLVGNAAVKKKDKKGNVIVVKKAKCEWWIEGVPTAALDYSTNPSYLVFAANGMTETEPLPIAVLAQEVKELPDLMLGQELNEQFYLPDVTNGWAVSGLPTGLKYTGKLLTTKKKSGKKTVVTTNALPYSVYGKTTKAGLFTITAKKKVGAYYETMKYRVLVTPKAVETAWFGEDLTNRTSMAYAPFDDWYLVNDVSATGGKVAKVTGLPPGLTFAEKDKYAYKDAKKKTGKYLQQKGQTIVGMPTKPGTYVVTFTKNVKSGKKTVAKTAQILWNVVPNDAELWLGFNTLGGRMLDAEVGLKWNDTVTFYAADGAKVTASGLPEGFSIIDRGEGKWGIIGSTTKAGTYLVTMTATLNGKTVRQRVALKVDPLPVWAKGTYNGFVNGSGGDTRGLATITVSSVGKISGKLQELGTNWTFSASCYTYQGKYSYYGMVSPCYGAIVTAKHVYKVKIGRTTVTKTLTRIFQLNIFWDGFFGYASLSEEGGSSISAIQNLWGTVYKSVGKKLFYTSKKVPYKTFTFKGSTEEGAAIGLKPEMSLTLKVTPNGAVAATLSYDTGKTKKDPKTKKQVKVIYKTTCASVVNPTSLPNAEKFTGQCFLYFNPSPANDFPGCIANAPFEIP